MRLSNLEEGSYNNAPEPKKMQVTVADKKANTEAWKRYQAGDSRYEFKNPTTEAEQEKAFLRRMQPGQPDIIEDAKGRDESVKNIDEILVKMGADAPSDIIADIMHWIDAHPGENLEDLIRQANGYYNDELEESYSPGDENEDGMVSNCCGASIMDVYDGHGRCSDCKEMASAEREEEYYESKVMQAREQIAQEESPVIEADDELQRIQDLVKFR